ncbi:hypothetical protein ERO13_A11G116700v2 [Gossypium hirsutum]|uniref:Zinc finger CCCH domain-containing protein 32 isoform X2 n=1 Tax=Gossypium hirsutum TaxID=3635 RepID=A0A1U8LCM7_GOSHI|nr:zinc finger CCCH domain-containing protein 32 isoform X2 [Gossypium hirsutum]KAG4174371.1 hypothetical protein ERO13_A11G116700v2 [Gossypium hirsutum]KAG4174372.1 hypothetical protein ERO13_A11G116700v2 [Gossypium hirsutum]
MMELYSRIQPRNGSQSGYQSEWSPAGPETGLEESMWPLSLGGTESYPERPGVPDCVYYMRTGFCGYGNRCRYNHPRNPAWVEAAVRATGVYPERPGEPTCQFYLKTGTCKFGASCKFHHPKQGYQSFSQVPLNIYGYPLRPGEKECSYYLKTGHCKFDTTCKFHHPQSAGTSIPASAPQFFQPVQSPSVPITEQYGGASTSARPPILPGSYVQGAYGHVLFSPGVVPIPGWSHYSAPVSSVVSPGVQPAVGATSLYGLTQLSSSTPSRAGPYLSLPSSMSPSSGNQNNQTFPERPGEPECQYYLRTGDCKFGSCCRYHHPRDKVAPWTNCILSPMGLPLRPILPFKQGGQPCSFYLQNGHCKFGSTCKFDHPMGTMRYSPSLSSLIDMPVAPYPVGSLLATLPPSSTSSELRPELSSGSKKDSYLSRIPSSSISSSSVGLIFSQTGSVPLSDLQHSSQNSVPLSSTRSTRQGGEVHRQTD